MMAGAITAHCSRASRMWTTIHVFFSLENIVVLGCVVVLDCVEFLACVVLLGGVVLWC